MTTNTSTITLPDYEWVALAYNAVLVLRRGLELEDASVLMSALSLLSNLNINAEEVPNILPAYLTQPILAFWEKVTAIEEPSFDHPAWQQAAHTLVADFQKAWLAWYDERRKERDTE